MWMGYDEAWNLRPHNPVAGLRRSNTGAGTRPGDKGQHLQQAKGNTCSRMQERSIEANAPCQPRQLAKTG